MRALHHYLRASPVGGPLFQFASGPYLTRATLSTILRDCFHDNVNINTHSFRIGGASAAAAAGVPYFVIQQLGRWSSDAFKRYIRLSTDYIEESYVALVTHFQ